MRLGSIVTAVKSGHRDVLQVYHAPGPWVNLSSASRFGEYEAPDRDIRDVVRRRVRGHQCRR